MLAVVVAAGCEKDADEMVSLKLEPSELRSQGHFVAHLEGDLEGVSWGTNQILEMEAGVEWRPVANLVPAGRGESARAAPAARPVEGTGVPPTVRLRLKLPELEPGTYRVRTSVTRHGSDDPLDLFASLTVTPP